jgi:hypothetical protein
MPITLLPLLVVFSSCAWGAEWLHFKTCTPHMMERLYGYPVDEVWVTPASVLAVIDAKSTDCSVLVMGGGRQVAVIGEPVDIQKRLEENR